jgi:hypothetical protein
MRERFSIWLFYVALGAGFLLLVLPQLRLWVQP